MKTIEYYHRRRKIAIIALGSECVQCGSQERLELDHIDPVTKTIKLSSDWYNDGWWDEVLTKCQLLCNTCHKEKSRIELRALNLAKGFTHGSVYAWMKRHCDCPTCTTAKRCWHDNRNAIRRTSSPSGEMAHAEVLKTLT